jgi:hypothetical protein
MTEHLTKEQFLLRKIEYEFLKEYLEKNLLSVKNALAEVDYWLQNDDEFDQKQKQENENKWKEMAKQLSSNLKKTED